MGVRPTTAISLSTLQLQGETKNAHRPSHGAYAQRKTLQAGTGISFRQKKKKSHHKIPISSKKKNDKSFIEELRKFYKN